MVLEVLVDYGRSIKDLGILKISENLSMRKPGGGLEEKAIFVLRHIAGLRNMRHFLLKYLVSRVKYDAAVEKLDLENR